MIRANLLPRRRETLSFFFLEVDLDLVREIGIGFAILIAIAIVGIELERLRVDRLIGVASELESRVAANAPQREVSRKLMLDIARYQEFERDATGLRRSGAMAAVNVARIGNSIPASVWVDEIARADNGYTIAGGARSIDAVAGAIAALGRSRVNERATLVGIRSREPSDSGVQFNAVLSRPVPSATPALAIHPPVSAR